MEFQSRSKSNIRSGIGLQGPGNTVNKKKRVRFRTAREGNLRRAYEHTESVSGSGISHNNDKTINSTPLPVVPPVLHTTPSQTSDNMPIGDNDHNMATSENFVPKLSFWSRYKGTIVLAVIISAMFICIIVVYFVNKHRRSKMLPLGVKLTNNYVDEFQKNLNEFDNHRHQ